MSVALRFLAVLVLAGSACREAVERSAQPANEPVVPHSVDLARSAEPEVRLAEIVSFDCGSSLPEKRGELVRAMQLGGPGGAAWNWDGGELVCTVRVSLHCRVQPNVTVSAGDHEQSAQVSQVSPETAIARATFAPAVWRALLHSDAQPFATLRMSARVEGSCADGDTRAGRPIVASDEFNAGFASGE
jgi:hypothetical protein